MYAKFSNQISLKMVPKTFLLACHPIYTHIPRNATSVAIVRIKSSSNLILKNLMKLLWWEKNRVLSQQRSFESVSTDIRL